MPQDHFSSRARQDRQPHDSTTDFHSSQDRLGIRSLCALRTSSLGDSSQGSCRRQRLLGRIPLETRISVHSRRSVSLFLPDEWWIRHTMQGSWHQHPSLRVLDLVVDHDQPMSLRPLRHPSPLLSSNSHLSLSVYRRYSSLLLPKKTQPNHAYKQSQVSNTTHTVQRGISLSFRTTE